MIRVSEWAYINPMQVVSVVQLSCGDVVVYMAGGREHTVTTMDWRTLAEIVAGELEATGESTDALNNLAASMTRLVEAINAKRFCQ